VLYVPIFNDHCDSMTDTFNPPHPGLTLRDDVLPALSLTVTEAAAQLNVTRAALSRVLNGQAAISPEMALRIEGWLGVENGGRADVWLAVQREYDLWHARKAGAPKVERAVVRIARSWFDSRENRPLMKPSVVLNLKRAEIRAAAIRFRTANPRVFGSVLHGTDQDGSDLDLLVDALPGTTLFDLGGLQMELEELLGVRVDLLTPGGLPEKFRDAVLAEALPV